MSVAAMILAAGRGSRFGAGADESKVLAQIDGVSMLAHVAKAVARSRAFPVVAVIGHAFARAKAELDAFDFTILRNEDIGLGLSHSLKLGLEAVPATAPAVMVLLADMPCVTAEVIDALILAYESADPAPLAVIPTHLGVRGNPVLLSRSLFDEIGKMNGDRGARGILDKMTDGVLEIPIDSNAISLDVDTREMLEAVKAFRQT